MRGCDVGLSGEFNACLATVLDEADEACDDVAVPCQVGGNGEL